MRDGSISTTHERFDAEFANKLARLESYNKHLYRPNTYLHKWWARRCGSTFRLILKSFVDRTGDRDYYAPGGLEGKIVLDPMLGGGTTLHEGIRLGANVVGYDVDPIPVLQARATLSDYSLALVEQEFAALLGALESTLSRFFLSECLLCGGMHPVRYLMYGLRQRCDCGEAILVDSFVIRRERDGHTTRLCEKCGKLHPSQEAISCTDKKREPRFYEKGTKRCPTCRRPFQSLLDVPFYQRYRPIIVVLNCEIGGLVHQSFSASDAMLLREANDRRAGITFPLSTAVTPGPKSDDLIRRGIADYQDLFSSRQLLFVRTAIDALESHEPQNRALLALLISTSLEFNVMLCGYKGSGARRAGAVRHAFSHHAYSFPYTAIENNPIFEGHTSGNLRQLFRDRVQRARLWAARPRERTLDGEGGPSSLPRFTEIEGETDYGSEVTELRALNEGTRRFFVGQGSAAKMALEDGSVDLVVTDPPYYDSVQYGALSAFFRVWLRQMVGPQTGGGIRWDYELSESAVDSGEDGDAHYLNTMSAIFSECRRVLRPQEGRLVFSFHHWKAAGWAAISVALKRAGFRVEAYYIVHSENPISVHIANMNALTDDAILVLAGDDAGVDKAWQEPASISTEGSAEFNRDCAEALGWILASELDEAAIANWWFGHLGAHGGRDRKRPPEQRR